MQKTFRVGGKSPRNALDVLLGVMACVFLWDRVSVVWFGSDFSGRYLPLSLLGLRDGYLWQLVTHMFMHGDIWHIFCNGIVLFFIGRLIERKYGGRRLLAIFFISGLMGAGAWLLFQGQFYGTLLGASAGCLGLFTYFCLVHENRPLIFLLFFILPVKLRPRTLLAITCGLEVFCFFTQELWGSNVAHSAHLGGILGGCLCYFFHQYRRKYARIFREKLARGSRSANAMYGDNYKLYITSYSARRSEVDRILDKINESGFKSLTEAERSTLNSAKHLMHR
ncbi:MAG: rhomboid family intramembrane serine protease [Puniceicoccales bacterium]|jgi:membrane associated rhomboid family serine protease|nr:rhomboid family intramembrane serine protease [Puniceicoccales bacterium]